jgi:rare lipoprotein A
MRSHRLLFITLPLIIGGCALSASPVPSPPVTASPKPAIYVPPKPPKPPKPAAREATASWYGSKFAGRPTTSGERFDPRRLTAASLTMPLGSVVKVENPKNGRSVRVRINDCGPLVHGRSLDLSQRAARKIGITHQGVARVKITSVKTPPNANIGRCSR